MWVYTSMVSSTLECPSSWAASLADRSASKQMVAKACRNWCGMSNRPGARWARDPVTGQSMTVPADMTYAQWYEKYVEKRDLGLTEEEEYAINSWVSSDFYPINEKLRQGIELTNEEKKAITNLDRALEKFPRYNGPVKRSLVISDPTELRKFTNTHAVGNTVTYNEYIAATCGKTYNPDAEVQIYIP